MTNPLNIRVRFAPSPTGYLHVGGLRTALYNYLFARKHHGAFVLRIEDTDQARRVEGAEEKLITALKWAGLTWDEGPDIGGPKGPYRQSERLAVYRSYALDLVASGNAYYAFDTPEELEQMRKAQEQQKLTPKYDRRALNLTKHEVDAQLAAGTPFVIRMKVPDATTIAFDDCVRGRVEFASEMIDDQVLLKSDGFPTYHLANVVDDHLMGISHVIRGEEWLSSTPKHVLLYNAFGWEMPQFAHLPLLLNPDKSKLSKRQGDVAVEDYRDKGYLPDALLNFVAFLGWNPGGEREIFSLDELVQEFSLERVGKAGAVFNVEKLNWMNFEYLRTKSDAEVLTMVKKHLKTSRFASRQFDDAYIHKVITAMRDRANVVKDFIEKGAYFFEAPSQYDSDTVKKRWKPESASHLRRLREEFASSSPTTKEDFESILHHVAAALNVKNADLIHPLRLAVSGVGGGPGLFDILAIIGNDETMRRITTAIEHLK